jgi:hypothetical protein
MTMAQQESLIELGVGHEWVLDSLKPQEFAKYPRFGDVYVAYVRELRGLPSTATRNLLDPSEDSNSITAPPYVREPAVFTSLDTGRVDVRLTVNLAPAQARWLEGLCQRLPEMYPNQPDKHDLGFAVAPWIMETMKQDTDRHGNLPVSGHSGTMTKGQLAAFRNGGA